MGITTSTIELLKNVTGRRYVFVTFNATKTYRLSHRPPVAPLSRRPLKA